MLIKDLYLQAFGPFTDANLEFGGSYPGLHVVYGPNESGKSSTLRALEYWLFGFPERTGDNFVHPNDRLRISGTLVHSQGSELTFIRRKKRKGSVLDSNGNVLDDGHIQAWLQGLTRETFEALFGLDHPGLLQGGTAILEEKGSAGSTLFSAGTGIASVERILGQIHEESKDIFKPRGTNPELNAAFKRYKDLQKEINLAALSSHAWKEKERALRQAEEELDKIKQSKKEVLEAEQRLHRLQQALRPLARLRQAWTELDTLGQVPMLPEDFTQRRQENQELLRQAEKTLSLARERLEKAKEKKEGIELNTELLNQAETISDLHQRLGAYRKGQADRRGLEEARVQEEAAAAAILRRIRPDLSPDQEDVLNDLFAQRREILAHGRKLDVLVKEAVDSSQAVQAREDELKEKKEELRALPPDRDHAALVQALEEASRLGDVDTALEKQKGQAAKDLEAFSFGLVRLGFWQGSPEDLLKLPLPLETVVRRFQKQWMDLEGKEKDVGAKEAEVGKSWDELHKEKQAQDLAGEVPSEDDLKVQRSRREEGWSLIRRAWMQGEDIETECREYAPELSLDQAYEQAVQAADHIADRLRWESSRVHERSRLEAELDQVRRQWAELEQVKSDLSKEWKELKGRWRQAWTESGIEPDTPEVMSDWQSGINQWRVTARQIIDNQAVTDELEAKRAAARTALEKALNDFEVTPPAGKTLAPVMKTAQKIRERVEHTAHERKTLIKTISGLERDLEKARKRAAKAEKDLKAWQEHWQTSLVRLGLPAGETPDTVAAFFDQLDTCLKHVQQAAGYAQRIQGIDQDGVDLLHEVHALLHRVAPELISLPLDQAVESLNGLMKTHQKKKTTLEACLESIESTEREIQGAAHDRKHALDQLQELCVLAGCEDGDYLEAVEQKWLRHKELQAIVHTEKTNLQEIAPKHSLDELMAEIDAQDPDSLQVLRQENKAQLQDLEAELEEQNKTVGRLRHEFAEMDGRDLAAQKAEEAQHELALIRRQAEQFTRLRLAGKVLEEAIERYRVENQDPVLALAGEYFRELTLGSFHALRTDVDDRGEQIIVGLREDASRVQVEGMSDGTRDQLYLALRLASLEHRLEKSEPMPFIVDDILVNFDEKRTEAALQAMGRLGEKNQVLVFSHHRQVADVVRELELGQVHTLE